MSVPCTPYTLPSLRRLQLLPRAGTHLPQKGPPGQSRSDPAQVVRRRARKGHWVHAGQTSFSERNPGSRRHDLEDDEQQKRERILAFVQVCGRGVCKARGLVEPALSARPEPRASASLSPPTPGKVGACSLAGPSPSSSERFELCPRPRPSPGCSRPGVPGFSSSPASPSGGRPAAARGPRSLAPPPRPAPANGPLCLLVFG